MIKEQEVKLNRIIELLEKAPMKAEQEAKEHNQGTINYAFAFGYLEAVLKAYTKELKELIQEEGGAK